MRFPLSLSYDLTRYLMKNQLRGVEKFPLVLMLEPTHQCNLACSGCGRIKEYRNSMGESLTLAQCLESVEECGAPVVTVTGGEPLLYPPVFELLQELVHRKKHIYLCTNAILLEKALPKLPRSKRLTLSVHLDGLAETHDRHLGRPGLFNTAIRGHQGRQAPGVPGLHQHHHLQGDRRRGNRESVCRAHPAGRGRHPGVTGLQF